MASVPSPLHKAFTLIEVMTVIIILGILAAIALPYYSKYTVTAHLVNAITEAKATEIYALNRMKRTMDCTPPTGAYTDTPKSRYFLGSIVYTTNDATSNICVLKFKFNQENATPKALKGQTLAMSLTETQNLFTYRCVTTVPAQYLSNTKCVHTEKIFWDVPNN